MGLFEKVLTVNEGINQSRTEPNAYLIDIRSKEFFQAGHVKGAINIPIDRLDLIEHRIKDKSSHLFLIGSYSCRIQKAKKALKKMGYTNITLSGNMEEHYGLLAKGK
ncbi:MAG: rhodanese-like domain-containing protein [Lachnospiraceae bacterium]|nr:rhodanese-like domain-containing protein [Lachnospiraceae bacterium]